MYRQIVDAFLAFSYAFRSEPSLTQWHGGQIGGQNPASDGLAQLASARVSLCSAWSMAQGRFQGRAGGPW
jgi:hypothetical protein